MSWGIVYLLYTISQFDFYSESSLSSFMLSQNLVPVRSVLPDFWIDYNIHADILASWRQQRRVMCAGGVPEEMYGVNVQYQA